jgi:hypothetical protein
MQEALIAAGFLVAASLIGLALKPDEDQLRPLTPQVAPDTGHEDHVAHH